MIPHDFPGSPAWLFYHFFLPLFSEPTFACLLLHRHSKMVPRVTQNDAPVHPQGDSGSDFLDFWILLPLCSNIAVFRVPRASKFHENACKSWSKTVLEKNPLPEAFFCRNYSKMLKKLTPKGTPTRGARTVFSTLFSIGGPKWSKKVTGPQNEPKRTPKWTPKAPKMAVKVMQEAIRI